MKLQLHSYTFVFSALGMLLLGCGGADDSEVAASEDAVSAKPAPADSCFENDRAEAKQRLASAIAHAQAYAAGELCTEEGMSLAEIAGDADAAIRACVSYRKVVATSPEAKPVRDVLAKSLALPIMLGEIDVTDTSGVTRWRGLGDALASGITLYELDDERDGADIVGYSVMATFDFSDGHVIQRTFESGTEETHTITRQGTFTLGRVLPRGGVELLVDLEGERRIYELVHEADRDALTVHGLSRDPAHRQLISMPLECP